MNQEMLNRKSLNEFFEASFKKYWDFKALTDFKGDTLYYRDLVRRIRMIHIGFEQCGLKQGDKVALCGRNQNNWAVAFLATITYGAVIVPILHEFKPGNIRHLVNHSDARIFFVGEQVWEGLSESEMPNLEAIVGLNDFDILYAPEKEIITIRNGLQSKFEELYPNGMTPEDICYHRDLPEELALINYTSGTTGFSKGVMLPYRSLLSNYEFLAEAIGSKLKPNCDVMAILPMAHMYGLSCAFILEFGLGNHIYFLTRLPSPSVIQEAFTDIHPAVIVSVPLIIEKIVRKNIFPKIQTNIMKLLMNMPVINKKVKEKILELVQAEFGGNMYEVIVGGAGLNKEIEDFLLSIGFPLTMGYGTTETAPMITFSDWNNFIGGSCGTVVKNMDVKILSEDTQNIPGEIVTRGLNVMTGYYKNQEATNAVIDENGWFHTGDLATMNAEGHIFIRGRKKNMLLGSNGQNIYPEEIENKLNSMAIVNESLIVQREERLCW